MIRMNETNITEKRIFFWDNLKGVLIALVVLGHFMLGYGYHESVLMVVGGIYTFHMPVFAFASGYLSAKSTAGLKKNLSLFLVAYAVFNTLAIFYFFLVDGQPVSFFVPYISFWYLLALIAWRLILRVVPKKPASLILAIAFAIIVGLSPQVTNEMALSRIIAFFPFFLAGAMIPWKQVYEYREKRKATSRMIGILTAVLTAALILVLVPRVLRFSELLMVSYVNQGDLARRVAVFAISFLAIASAMLLLPDRKVRFLSSWGRNSLSVYLIHRFITLVAVRLLPFRDNPLPAVIVSVVGTILVLAVFGSDMAERSLRAFLVGIADRLKFSPDSVIHQKNRVFRLTALLIVSVVFALSVIGEVPDSVSSGEKPDTRPAIANVLTEADREAIDHAVSIAFIGDLILLRGQVVAAYDHATDSYDFSEMFRYAAPYLDADLTIGVFEGPMAGKEAGYSSSDYDDGLALSLNFPDSFAASVREAGIEWVTLANNHLLDKGLEGAYRTVDVLDRAGISHIGSYRNAEEKNAVRMIEKDGLRIAFLEYTFASNGWDDEYFLFENKDLTRLIVSPESEFFDEVRTAVENDFERVRGEDPDIIIVLPHMGTQFTHETDAYQDAWNGIFIRAGADIVFGDHAHAVQPIEYVTDTGADDAPRTAIIVNCPGNFANSFVRMNGDATAIVKVYIDPASGEILCSSVIPMWTHGNSKGFFRALPIFEILTNAELHARLSANDMSRVREVQHIVTSVMLGTSISTDRAQDEYFLFPDGYRRQKSPPLEMEADEYRTEQIRMIREAESVCFVGDSLSNGSNNGGYPWFEALTASFPEKDFESIAEGGATSRTLLAAVESETVEAQLFIIAVGANDIRYRDESICAMTPESYTSTLRALVRELRKHNRDAKFIFVAPWPSLAMDPFTPLLPEEKNEMYCAYTTALEIFCGEDGHLFVDPTRIILDRLASEPVSEYLTDHIHPNGTKGIRLYSHAFSSAGRFSEPDSGRK